MGTGLRLARAGLAASVATGVALASHVLGGGHAPSPAGVAVPLVLSFVVCAHLSGHLGSWWRTGVGVAVSQALFHTLFVVGSGHVTVASGAGASTGAASHAHHMAPATVAASTSESIHGAHGGGVMTLAHVVAVVATTAALVRLDWALGRAMVAIGVLFAPVVALLTTTPAVTSGARLVAVPRTPVRLVQSVRSWSWSLRGPPVLTV